MGKTISARGHHWRARRCGLVAAVVVGVVSAAAPCQSRDILPSPATKPAGLSWYQWALDTNSLLTYRYFISGAHGEAFLAYRAALASKVDGRLVSIGEFDRLTHEALARAEAADFDTPVLPFACSIQQRIDQICPW